MKRASLAILCVLPFAAGAETGLQLKMQRTLIVAPAAPDENVPVFLEADRLQGHSERETEVEGGVQLRRRGQAVDADCGPRQAGHSAGWNNSHFGVTAG